eukprot:SAG31_NODE_10482_length_1133_cov_1.247582_1_plen_173_part_00
MLYAFAVGDPDASEADSHPHRDLDDLELEDDQYSASDNELTGETAEGVGLLAPEETITTEGGCTCLPFSEDGRGTVLGSGCIASEGGSWCDVAPGCTGAKEATDGYAGWDSCSTAQPHFETLGQDDVFEHFGFALKYLDADGRPIGHAAAHTDGSTMAESELAEVNLGINTS